MSEAPSIKSEDTKAIRHFQENNYEGDDLHENRNEIEIEQTNVCSIIMSV